MSKVVNTINVFLQTDYNGSVVKTIANNNAVIQNSWSGVDCDSAKVEVSGSSISCQANQRIRVAPLTLEFNKSLLPVVNKGNNVFFVRDSANNTLTPITIPVGNVVCVGDGGTVANQVPNSLVAAINRGLVDSGNAGWGTQGGFHVTVENDFLQLGTFPSFNSMGNLRFNNLPPNLNVLAIRDTNFQNGNSVFNSSAYQLMGLYLNEVHFLTGVPDVNEITNLSLGCPFSNATEEVAGKMPYLSPIDHVYLRSNTLLPNGMAQQLNGQNISSGLVQSNIIARIPYNEGVNYALNGLGGLNYVLGTGGVQPPQTISAYSGDKSQWMWKNQYGKEYSFFVPGNIISNIQFELTNFQGTRLTELSGVMPAGNTEGLRKNGFGVFLALRFDILE